MVLRQLTKEQAKEEVKKIVDKYNRIVESGSIKRYKEEDTKAEFIEPLFEALGWDVRNTENDDEVVREEKISKGRVDYSFRINGIPKFFLEAKALKEDLDNIKFVEQSINYAWHKGCTWAVLTDFEAIKIFNAEWKSTNPLQAQFGQTLPCQLFLEKFDQLWLLSRESFEKKLLDTEAEKWGKKVNKISVDKQLLGDLTKFRDLLNKNILKNNPSKNLSADDLDEAVQRIIDRLIFIRTLEDKELEAPMLQSVIREDLNKRIYKKLNLIFRKIDDVYNSKLFTPHLCESLEIDDEVLSKIINGLFNTSDNTVHYDFSAIDADVLGNIYEQYLGHILKKTDKRAKLAEGKAHRKEQGIYYTPTYVVDYIVKNTVGELAKDKKFDLKNIRILDPACGSGSFLMKAFDYLVTLDKKKNGEIEQTKLDLTSASATYGRKVEILTNNIFGVDLDPKAVEIAQLNLLLKAAEKKHRLPTLQENIKVGNSLIDDSAVAGDRAFKWEERFKDVMQNGGFDVVIGNPPYVKIQTFSKKDETSYFLKNFKSTTGNFDIYVLFIEKGFNLLKIGGLFGMILPHKFFQSEFGLGIRKFIKENQCLYKIVDFRDNQVFDGATTYTCLLFLKKTNNKRMKYFEINSTESISNKLNEKRQDFSEIELSSLNDNKWIFSSSKGQRILDKINACKSNLGLFCESIFQGIATGADGIFFLKVIETKGNITKVYSKELKEEIIIETELLKPLIKGDMVKRFSPINSNECVLFPYKEIEGRIKLIEENELKKYHNAHKYLKKFEKDLRKRENNRFDNENWFCFSRNQGMSYINVEKILTPDICQKGQSSLDLSGKFLTTTTVYGVIPKENKDLKYLLALLNSSLLRYFIKKTGSILRGGFYRYKTAYLKPFPVPKITDNSKQNIENSIDKILSLNKRLNEIKYKQTDQKAQLEKEIQKIDNEIDEEVYKIYGITEDEKKVIEESLK